MVRELEPIIQHINAGNYRRAERALEAFLLHNPKIIDAWMLLGQLRDDYSGKAECYRQVLSIDPGNVRAERRLEAIEKQIQELPSEAPAPPKTNQPIHCPQCDAIMELRQNGSEESRHAFCVYCGTQLDLAEPYPQRTIRLTLEERLQGNHTDGTIPHNGSRNGTSNLKVNGSIPPELMEILEILKTIGPEGVDEDYLENLRSKGIDIAFNPEAVDSEILAELQNGEYDPSLEIKHTRSLKSVLLGLDEQNGRSHTAMLSGLGITIKTPDSKSSAADILALDMLASIGKPLAADDRQKCPNPTCGAVIPKDSIRCSWCGRELR
ncbi:MAG: hypothetical protein JW757_03480 [Anaerolineales bacterium]|nr:hypothetical protein [Anaerolineales bacterium]